MKYPKKFNEDKALPREWQIKALAGSLNSYQHISMTDDRSTFDFHMREQDGIKEKLVDITSAELFELYLLLNENGVSNMTRLFSSVFHELEKKTNADPSLNIWDFRKMKDLYFKSK